MSDCFIGTGLYKLNSLMARNDFEKVKSVVYHAGVIVIVLNFKSQSCTLNSFGKCIWVEKQKDE